MAIGKLAIGDQVDLFLLIKESTKGIASNGKPFLTLILGDSTGEIEAKLWGVQQEDIEQFQVESIVKVVGDINQFRGKAQLRIQSIKLAEPSDNVNIADYVKKSPVDVDVLREKMTEAIFEMENATLQRIVRAFIKKYQDAFFTYPAAAKIHHDYVSGLAHHTISMLDLARKICELYPDVNKDLLFSGVILHDIGKIKELSGVVTTTYTTEGKLLGHISLMVDEIGLMARELQVEEMEEVVMLKHLVLSHHGKPEWGSPKQPLIREAELLHLIDLIDARMNMLNRALEKTVPGEFTEKLFGLDNRSFYKPTFD